MKFKNLNIKNFRGFSELKLENFGRVNLLLGNNNSGKTTVLEALFLILGGSNPKNDLNINSLRGLRFEGEEDFRYFFHKLDYNNIPEIKSEFSREEYSRILKINPLYKDYIEVYNDFADDLGDENRYIPKINTTSNTIEVLGLINEFLIKETVNKPPKKYNSSIVYQNGRPIITPPKNYIEEISGAILNSDIHTTDIIGSLENIIKSKQQDKIINVLNQIDKRIKDITIFTNRRIFFDLDGIDHLVPINIMGDGIRRLLSLITIISETTGGVVLVDEIENGLHYSAHKKLWEAVLVACKEYDVQLFITTHNIETLKCLMEVAKNEIIPNSQEEIKAYTIKSLNNGVFKSYRYDFPEFEHAIEQETEIR